MTIPHPGPQDPLVTAGDDTAGSQEPPVTYNQASSVYSPAPAPRGNAGRSSTSVTTSPAPRPR
jgi:hypothetical protein